MERLIEGFSMMLIGMGTVFTFLCLLVIVMHIMAYCVKYLNKLFPEPIAVPANKSNKSSNNDEEVALAIVTAVHNNSNNQ